MVPIIMNTIFLNLTIFWCVALEKSTTLIRFVPESRKVNIVADPGFPRQGRQPRRRGRQPIIWPIFTRKLHENERN